MQAYVPVNRIRHIFFCSLCITKHQPWSPHDCFDLHQTFYFLLLKCFINTHSNICRLLINMQQNCTGISVKTISDLVIPISFTVSRTTLNVHICFVVIFTCYQEQNLSGKLFTSHTLWGRLPCKRPKLHQKWHHKLVRMSFSY